MPRRTKEGWKQHAALKQAIAGNKALDRGLRRAIERDDARDKKRC